MTRGILVTAWYPRGDNAQQLNFHEIRQGITDDLTQEVRIQVPNPAYTSAKGTHPSWQKLNRRPSPTVLPGSLKSRGKLSGRVFRTTTHTRTKCPAKITRASRSPTLRTMSATSSLSFPRNSSSCSRAKIHQCKLSSPLRPGVHSESHGPAPQSLLLVSPKH